MLMVQQCGGGYHIAQYLRIVGRSHVELLPWDVCTQDYRYFEGFNKTDEGS